MTGQLLPTRLCAVAYAAAPMLLDQFARKMGAAHWTEYAWQVKFHPEEVDETVGMFVGPLGNETYLLLRTPEGGLPGDEHRFELAVCDGAPEYELLTMEVQDGRVVGWTGTLTLFST